MSKESPTKEPSTRPKMPATIHFLYLDKYLGNPTFYMGGGSGEGGDELGD